MRLHSILSKITRDEVATSSVEYGLILAFIVLVMLIALQAMASQTVQMWSDVAEKSSKAATAN
ncbi:Flp family type IVb pilin [Novosphingobium sp. BL-52-GroH]|uniref:Flp family type IVb pilin n=1 Tax=Novosphingobium sp. BL-52-GroH TaxID=3349877 RepID=UPI0038509E74